MQTKFKTHYNAKDWGLGYEVNNQPSMTVPDQAMSIQEIMRRFASGLPLGGSRIPLYEEDGDMVDFERMDLPEREQYVREAAEELKATQERIKEAKRKKEAPSKEPTKEPEKEAPNASETK